MTAVMFFLAVAAVFVIAGGIFGAGFVSGFFVARKRCRKTPPPRRQDPDPTAVALFAALSMLATDPGSVVTIDADRLGRRPRV